MPISSEAKLPPGLCLRPDASLGPPGPGLPVPMATWGGGGRMAFSRGTAKLAAHCQPLCSEAPAQTPPRKGEKKDSCQRLSHSRNLLKTEDGNFNLFYFLSRAVKRETVQRMGTPGTHWASGLECPWPGLTGQGVGSTDPLAQRMHSGPWGPKHLNGRPSLAGGCLSPTVGNKASLGGLPRLSSKPAC